MTNLCYFISDNRDPVRCGESLLAAQLKTLRRSAASGRNVGLVQFLPWQTFGQSCLAKHKSYIVVLPSHKTAGGILVILQLCPWKQRWEHMVLQIMLDCNSHYPSPLIMVGWVMETAGQQHLERHTSPNVVIILNRESNSTSSID